MKCTKHMRCQIGNIISHHSEICWFALYFRLFVIILQSTSTLNEHERMLLTKANDFMVPLVHLKRHQKSSCFFTEQIKLGFNITQSMVYLVVDEVPFRKICIGTSCTLTHSICWKDNTWLNNELFLLMFNCSLSLVYLAL